MLKISLIIIIISLIAIAIIVFFLLYYKRYLKRRLDGLGKIQNLPQPLTFIVIAILVLSLGCNVIFALDSKNSNNAYKELLEKVTPASVNITDFTNSEYVHFRDAMLGDNLIGYDITLTTDGDFECYVALLIDGIDKISFMPQYFIYICYIGEVLDDFQMERTFYYNEAGNGYGSTGSFKPEILIIGNSLEPQFFLGIKTIIKNVPLTTQTKKNWDLLPIYSESYFEIKIKKLN